MMTIKITSETGRGISGTWTRQLRNCRSLGVTVVSRDGSLYVSGPEVGIELFERQALSGGFGRLVVDHL